MKTFNTQVNAVALWELRSLSALRKTPIRVSTHTGIKTVDCTSDIQLSYARSGHVGLCACLFYGTWPSFSRKMFRKFTLEAAPCPGPHLEGSRLGDEAIGYVQSIVLFYKRGQTTCLERS